MPAKVDVGGGLQYASSRARWFRRVWLASASSFPQRTRANKLTAPWMPLSTLARAWVSSTKLCSRLDWTRSRLDWMCSRRTVLELFQKIEHSHRIAHRFFNNRLSDHRNFFTLAGRQLCDDTLFTGMVSADAKGATPGTFRKAPHRESHTHTSSCEPPTPINLPNSPRLAVS